MRKIAVIAALIAVSAAGQSAAQSYGGTGYGGYGGYGRGNGDLIGGERAEGTIFVPSPHGRKYGGPWRLPDEDGNGMAPFPRNYEEWLSYADDGERWLSPSRGRPGKPSQPKTRPEMPKGHLTFMTSGRPPNGENEKSDKASNGNGAAKRAGSKSGYENMTYDKGAGEGTQRNARQIDKAIEAADGKSGGTTTTTTAPPRR